MTFRHTVNIAKYLRRLLRPHLPLSNNIPQIKSNALQYNCHTKREALAPVTVPVVSDVPTSHIYIPVIPNISEENSLKIRYQTTEINTVLTLVIEFGGSRTTG